MARRKLLFGLSAVAAIVLLSCSTNESCLETGTCPDIYMERTDIQISGDLSIWENQVAYEVDHVTGPIMLNFYSQPSNQLDFQINMENGYTLTITMNNQSRQNPWTHVGMGYPAYPGQDLATKIRYVSAELRMGGDVAAYSTNQAGMFSAEEVSSAFWISSCDEHQIKCRIRDLPLYLNVNQQKKIVINGTFIAVNGVNGNDL